MTKLAPGEQSEQAQELDEVLRVRRVIADTYTFVRSQEINRTIASFTMDHYIDEAKRAIKGDGRGVRDASGRVVDLRPAKLELLDTLENEFRQTLEAARELAKKADETTEEESE